MRSRNIKPGFFTNEQLAVVSIEARLLFVGLWCMADREGRLEYRPKRIKMTVFPADSIDVEPLMHELLGSTLVVMYEAQGNTLVWIPGFAKHQRPHPKEVASTLPPYLGSNRVEPGLTQKAMHEALGANKVEPRCGKEAMEGGGIRSDILNPDVLNPDTPSLREGIEQPAAVLTLDDASESTARSPFARFWEAYPKKAKRKDAHKVWASKRLDGKADALIADVKRRLAEDRRWLEGFVPDPTTYLRGERWNDAIEPVKPNGVHANGAEAEAKSRAQIIDLAKIMSIAQGDDDWTTFKGRVERANARRLEQLEGRRRA